MIVKKKVLIKCRNSHWFSGHACPVDGYYDDFVDQVLAAERTILEHGCELTLDALITEGRLDADAANTRILVLEIGQCFPGPCPDFCVTCQLERN
ncbi:MAG: hypothetical protein ACYC6Y_16440 [Thermoguttaceae bacterium]